MPDRNDPAYLAWSLKEGRLTRRQLLRRLGALGVGLPAAGALLAACGGAGGSGSGGSTSKQKISLGIQQEPTSTDIVGDANASIGALLRDNVFEGLVRIDADGNVVPQLASSWDVSSDGTQYTFRLRPNAKWHDGSAFTAQDVKYSWQRAMDPSATPPNPYPEYWAPVQSIDVVDPTTVKVTLKQYSFNFLFHMTAAAASIVSQAAIGSIASRPVGTGPYKFGAWNRGSDLTLVRNDAYWGPKAKLRQVDFKFITDPNAMNNALTAGDIDVISQVNGPEQLTSFSSESQFKVLKGAPYGKLIVTMNNTSPVLKDVRVRQAISAVIDRAAWVKGVYSGYGVPIGSHAAPNKGEPYYIDLTSMNPHDPQKAKQLLSAAGQPNLSVRLAVLTDHTYASRGAQILISALKDVGVTAQVQDVQFAQWLAQVFGGPQDFDLTIIDHVEERDIFNYGNPKYYWHYDNPQVTSWLTQADATVAESERNGIYAKVQRQLATDAANGFVMSLNALAVASSSVKGYAIPGVSPSIFLRDVTVS
ncbi:MAG: ABC transporter substrate-binding protein [Candidatus Dormiibacterota bacterium]